VAVLARMNRRVDFEGLPRGMRSITVVCPACRRRQPVVLGGDRCAGCGLRIEVRVEEPRCRRCGYLLLRLSSDVCPECGTPVAAATA
jgi:rRNA maturation endonuclease Nob1